MKLFLFFAKRALFLFLVGLVNKLADKLDDLAFKLTTKLEDIFEGEEL